MVEKLVSDNDTHGSPRSPTDLWAIENVDVTYLAKHGPVDAVCTAGYNTFCGWDRSRAAG